MWWIKTETTVPRSEITKTVRNRSREWCRERGPGVASPPERGLQERQAPGGQLCGHGGGTDSLCPLAGAWGARPFPAVEAGQPASLLSLSFHFEKSGRPHGVPGAWLPAELIEHHDTAAVSLMQPFAVIAESGSSEQPCP